MVGIVEADDGLYGRYTADGPIPRYDSLDKLLEQGRPDVVLEGVTHLDKAALEFTGIDPDHPFRKEIAVDEKQALQDIFLSVRSKIKEHSCKRAILVGHNASFDLGFLNAAVERTGIKRNPFHPFSTFDTATLGGLAYGQTVLSRAVEAAGIEWDGRDAHSAIYDAEKTAELFCAIVNRWAELARKLP